MKNRRFLALLMVLLLLLTVTGCGMSLKAESAPNAGKDFDSIQNSVAEKPNEAPKTEPAGVQNRKLIRTMTMEAETDDLDALLAALEARVATLGGYIEKLEQRGNASTSYSYRYANLTIRIPVGEMDGFVDHVTGQSNITYRHETADDVTLSYVATESRIRALETEEARLLELMAMAKNMEDLLLIEKRLTEVRTELEQVTSQLRLYDNLIDFGTIHLNLQQVTKFTDTTQEPTVWQRIGSGFLESLEGIGDFFVEIFVWVVVASPYLAILAVMVIVIVLLVKKASKKHKKASNDPQ